MGSSRRIAVCALLITVVSVMGCSRGAKKDAEFEPAANWLTGMRADIEEHVPDAERKEKMLVMADRIQEQIDALDADVKAFYKEWAALDRDRDAAREEFEKAYRKFNVELEKRRDAVLDAIFELKSLATREEWEELSDQDETIYESWRRYYQVQ